jgi:hypothetical protein
MQGRKRHAVAEKALTKNVSEQTDGGFLGIRNSDRVVSASRTQAWLVVPFFQQLEPKVEDASTLVQQQLAVQQTVSLLDKRSRQEAARKHISAARLQLILLGLEFGLIGPNPGYAKSWMMTVTVFNAQSGIT